MTEELIQKGIEKGFIRFDDDRKNIFYIHQDKRRNYNNPEEQVQAETFLKLVLEYGYYTELKIIGIKLSEVCQYKSNEKALRVFR
jgi:hypothetical protein